MHRIRMKSQRWPLTRLNFIEPMYASLVNALPKGKEWIYEVKFDGYRCLTGRDSTGMTFCPSIGSSANYPSLIVSSVWG
jgi:ATP-dependent DNA ligase